MALKFVMVRFIRTIFFNVSYTAFIRLRPIKQLHSTNTIPKTSDSPAIDFANLFLFWIMNFLGNLIWLVFGGLFAAIGYVVGGLVLCLTVVGIPFGLQCFKLAGLVLWPFGKKVVPASSAGGCWTVFANILWILVGGIVVTLNHLIMGALLFITIIGIPWARQHFKLIEISLLPFGKKVVRAD
jgi:uncharacterized membrane protein YccF (DUF307 family)